MLLSLFRSLVLLVFALAFAPALSAQIQVELKLARRLFITYEPLIATVTVTNLSGRDLDLDSEGGKQWFGLEVTNNQDNLLVPFDPDYRITPLRIRSGERVVRKLDIAPLFPIRDFGQYRVRATIFVKEMDRFFASNVQAFDLTDGRTIMRQTVGVPGTGELRELQLMSFQLPTRLNLYVRIRDRASGVVYGTQNIGRYLPVVSEPQTMLDGRNQLHILHQAAPRTFLYTVIGLDGDRLGQDIYVAKPGGRPTLARNGAQVTVRGGVISREAPDTPDDAPSIGTRPPGLPGAR